MNAWISRCIALAMLAAVFGGGCSSSESSTNSDALRVRVADGELNYVFGSLIETVDEESRGVSALMQPYWTRFAIAGDPGSSLSLLATLRACRAPCR